MTVKRLEDLGQAQIQECAPRAVAEFQSSVRPIYGVEDGRLTHVGSCLLLDVGGHRVLSTAGHVADNLAQSPLFVGGRAGTHPVHLQVRFRGTAAPDGDRRKDHFDYAYCVLAERDVATLGGVEFLGPPRISHNRVPTEGRAYTAFGYAISHNKNSIDHTAGSIANRLSMFTGQLVNVPPLAAQLPRGGEAHLTLRFNKHAYTADGECVNAFGPKGLSGGVLLYLGDFASSATYVPIGSYRATLSGMLIEHRKEHRVMIAVKIGPIVEGIRRDLA